MFNKLLRKWLRVDEIAATLAGNDNRYLTVESAMVIFGVNAKNARKMLWAGVDEGIVDRAFLYEAKAVIDVFTEPMIFDDIDMQSVGFREVFVTAGVFDYERSRLTHKISTPEALT